jgi:hypothetical protein
MYHEFVRMNLYTLICTRKICFLYSNWWGASNGNEGNGKDMGNGKGDEAVGQQKRQGRAAMAMATAM